MPAIRTAYSTSRAPQSFAKLSIRGIRAPRSSWPISVRCRPERKLSSSWDSPAALRAPRRLAAKRSEQRASLALQELEVEGPSTRTDEVARRGDQASAEEFPNRAGDRVFLGEVFSVEGEGQFVDLRPGRVLVEQERQHGTFRSAVFGSGVFSAAARRVLASHEELS